MWGGAEWNRLAERLAPVHATLVDRLAPRPGERWLDVGTGNGAVALRAARAGADVTGLDLSEALLEEARKRAHDAGLTVRFDLGDAQRLPYGEASFDVVSSSFGVIFAPDAVAAAGELARVVRPGGRLGLTAWRPNERMKEISERFAGRAPAADISRWGRDGGVEALLDDAFSLDVSEHVWRLEAGSPEELWDFMSTAAPPTKALLDVLDADGRRGYREAMLRYWDDFRTEDGVSEPAPYLLVLGTRR
jgi:SAM-dependent methyltransferase